ncbi:MAG: hypothetical protein U9N42_00015 [Campylobacterota bacterium]|nr:hypothetical protein [Campylobacterota bacterium]
MYSMWFEEHAIKHEEIMKRLEHLSDEEVIEHFVYENMQKNEPTFCPLYEKNEKCHELKELNCYLCGCPNFRFDDNGYELIDNKKLMSRCNINSKDGEQFITPSAIHQNCTNCTIPHHKEYIKKLFSRSWREIMSELE